MTMKVFKTLIDLAWELMVAGVVASMCVYSFQHIYYRYVDTSHWMTYESVEPTKKVFRLGEPVTFQSKAIVRRTWTGNYPDALYCRELHVEGSKFRFVTAATTTIKTREARIFGYEQRPEWVPDDVPMLGGVWEWEGALPKEQSECYLQAQPEVHYGLNSPRVVPVPSSEFFRLVY